MARSRDPKKVALWQGRFRRFVDSGLSVVRFCAAEGVSEASFYYWQKKLGRPRRRRAARAKTGVAPSEGCGTGGELDRVRANGRAARGEVRGRCVNSRSIWANGRDAGENDRGVFRSAEGGSCRPRAAWSFGCRTERESTWRPVNSTPSAPSWRRSYRPITIGSPSRTAPPPAGVIWKCGDIRRC